MPEHRPSLSALANSPETGTLYRSLLSDEALGSEAALLVARAANLETAAGSLSELMQDQAPTLPDGGPHSALLALAFSRVDWITLALALTVEDDPAGISPQPDACPAPLPQTPAVITHYPPLGEGR